MSSGFSIGVVGATGQVGREFLRILGERDRPNLPIRTMRLFASQRSAGSSLSVRGAEYRVELALPDPTLFEGLDFVITAVGDEQARIFAPAVAAAGALDVDKSNAWRMDPTVPLVVPEVNPLDARDHRGIIAGPNCSTTQLVLALWPLHALNPIQRVVVDTYQAVSGTGWRAVDELREQTVALAGGERIEPCVYPRQIVQNLIPEIGGYKGNGVYSEEKKMVDETRKILHAPDLLLDATCVRVPVMVGHAEAVHIVFEHPMTPESAREILATAPGVRVLDVPAESVYPTPLDAAGNDDVLVGRIRRDLSHPNGLALFVVGDNLRKGAALNAVQVFELVAREGWLGGARALAGST